MFLHCFQSWCTWDKLFAHRWPLHRFLQINAVSDVPSPKLWIATDDLKDPNIWKEMGGFRVFPRGDDVFCLALLILKGYDMLFVWAFGGGDQLFGLFGFIWFIAQILHRSFTWSFTCPETSRRIGGICCSDSEWSSEQSHWLVLWWVN